MIEERSNEHSSDSDDLPIKSSMTLNSKSTEKKSFNQESFERKKLINFERSPKFVSMLFKNNEEKDKRISQEKSKIYSLNNFSEYKRNNDDSPIKDRPDLLNESSSHSSINLEKLKKIRLSKKASKKKSYIQKASFSQFIIHKKSLKKMKLLQEGAFGKVYLGTYIG